MVLPARLRLAVAAAVVCCASCAEPPVQPVETVTRSSFERIETGIFASGCAVSGCHAGPSPAASMSLEAGRAYASLVGVRASNPAAAAAGLVRVRPSRPDSSFLVRKLTGVLDASHGARMPLGSSPLHASAIEFIRQWIAAGAPLTGDVADTSLLHAAHGHGGQHELDHIPPPSHGFQLHLPPFEVPARNEREVFYATRPPIAGSVFVTGFRVVMRDNSHHFTLYAIPAGSRRENTIRDRGANIDEFLIPRGFLFGTQEADVSYSLPPGIGIRLDPDDLIDLNVHAVNPTSATIAGEAYVNVFTAAHVERVAEPLLWSFDRFVLPAHTERTLYDTLDNATERDLLMLTTHFHEHGRRFRIYRFDDTQSTMIYENLQWNHPVIARYDPPLRLAAGERLRLEAVYVNDTDHDIRYGPRSENEMCSIFGLVVPVK